MKFTVSRFFARSGNAVAGALALLALVGAGAAEALLLERILNHPAGGSAVAEGALASMLVWASVPLLGGAALVVLRVQRGHQVPWGVVAVVCIVGPLLCFIALRQYSHATPGLLQLGLLVQCLSVAAGWWRVRGAT